MKEKRHKQCRKARRMLQRQRWEHLLMHIEEQLDRYGRIEEKDIVSEDMWPWVSGQIMAYSHLGRMLGNDVLEWKGLIAVCHFTDLWNEQYRKQKEAEDDASTD